MIQHFSAILNKEESLYVAYCPELDVTSQGETIEEAEQNLQEAIKLYIESFGIGDVKRPHPPILTTIPVEVPQTSVHQKKDQPDQHGVKPHARNGISVNGYFRDTAGPKK